MEWITFIKPIISDDDGKVWYGMGVGMGMGMGMVAVVVVLGGAAVLGRPLSAWFPWVIPYTLAHTCTYHKPTRFGIV